MNVALGTCLELSCHRIVLTAGLTRQTGDITTKTGRYHKDDIYVNIVDIFAALLAAYVCFRAGIITWKHSIKMQSDQAEEEAPKGELISRMHFLLQTRKMKHSRLYTPAYNEIYSLKNQLLHLQVCQ